MAKFVHLHNHSEYSLLDGLSKVKDMVKHAKKIGMDAIAITDHGSMYGAIKFYKACLEADIKPIIGCEIYVAKRTLHDKEAGVDKDYNHLILLAKNETGYKNLMKIVTVSYLDGYYYKPRTDLDLLKKYSEGLICLSACVNGYVADPLTRDEDEIAEKRAIKLNEIFGQGNFYFELQRHTNVPPQEPVNKKLLKLSKKLGIPLVATNDNHYTTKSDAEAQEILLCIQTQTTILDKNRKLSMISSPDFYIKTAQEMTEQFSDLPEAIENTVKIADACNIQIELGKWHMPIFEVPDEKTSAEYLKELTYKGLEKRYPEITEAIKERVDYELSIITKKKYETYFLIVADFVNWAKDHGISVGPGRGSAAGSVVSYALQITDVDPFFFKLPFERFLNPERPSAPDIDLDFADTRRDEVIDYVTEKYGRDKVAQIITFGTMEARGSVRDAGRALGMPYASPDRISKMIPPGWQGHAMTIDSALSQSPDLKRAYESEPETKRLLDVAKKLEGVARHASVHAAGVVIADRPLTEYTPLQRETNGDKIVTQYDMYTVGEDGVGLLKMDFLGLRNLTIIEESLKFIRQNQGAEIDFTNVPLDDQKTYSLLSDGETTGIFQLESAGMRRNIKDLKPTSIFDLQAMVALYRPGPMAIIPEFIKRKNNPSLITYPDPRLEEILKETYGVLTFQDDVLLTAIALAGYTWLDADKFRKAMGKKITSEMKKQEEMFIDGCVKNGLPEKKAREIFNLIAPFAGYGFNKAHAACYATIAFRTAYLKAHYPVEFMTALLTAESRGTTGPVKNEKIAQAVAECKRLGVSVLPPDINKSLSDFSIENKKSIRFGLSAIKNVGEAAIESILEARKDHSFMNLQDFCNKVSLQTVNKKTMESLIKAGAMDTFGNRASLLIGLPEVASKASALKKQSADGQGSLFGDEPEKIEVKEAVHQDVDDFTKEEKLTFEKEFLGFYLTSHPYMDTLTYIKRVITHEIEFLETEKEGTIVKVGGIVETSRKIVTKKTNSEMAFISLGDEKGITIECIIFPRVFEQYKQLLITDSVIVIEGKVDLKDERPIIIVDKIYEAKSFAPN
ncbi:MAG: DNA polymerase III subunit alpha [Candidatus Levybacteria bacterium]|nr:DNA polymerase III subunit alpha [Candidatus Levybacteria bacterium]